MILVPLELDVIECPVEGTAVVEHTLVTPIVPLVLFDLYEDLNGDGFQFISTLN